MKKMSLNHIGSEAFLLSPAVSGPDTCPDALTETLKSYCEPTAPRHPEDT